MEVAVQYSVPSSGVESVEKPILETSDGDWPIKGERECQLGVANIEILEELNLQPLDVLLGRVGKVGITKE